MSRNYTKLTIKLLFGQARSCAYPGCDAALIYEDRGRETVVAEVAHIRSESPGGPRHDPSFTGDLDGPENLLLLCGIHHKPVDRHDDAYSVEELVAWKVAQRAGAGAGVEIAEAEAARFIQLSAGERAVIEALARLGYRLEQAASSAGDALAAIDADYQRAHESAFAAMGPMFEVDDDGNRTRISSSSFRLPQTQISGFQKAYSDELVRHQAGVAAQATQLGEEVAVLRMMDRHLGAIAGDVAQRAGALALALGETEPRWVVGFEVILGAYSSLLSMAATGSVLLVS